MPTDFRVTDQDWFKTGMEAKGPQWFRVVDHPIGPRPSIAFAGPIDVYQQRQGVLAIIIEYTRLSRFLAQLEVGKTGTAFILDESGELIAAPDKNADELHPAQSQLAMLPLAGWRIHARGRPAARNRGGDVSPRMARPMKSG